jgi:hypothetical protein
MKKNGNIFLGVTIGLFIFVIGVLIIPFFTDDITTARSDLVCSVASGLTGGQMIVCLMHDALVPYLIWFFCSLAIGYLIGSVT